MDDNILVNLFLRGYCSVTIVSSCVFSTPFQHHNHLSMSLTQSELLFWSSSLFPSNARGAKAKDTTRLWPFLGQEAETSFVYH